LLAGSSPGERETPTPAVLYAFDTPEWTKPFPHVAHASGEIQGAEIAAKDCYWIGPIVRGQLVRIPAVVAIIFG
jgi:hypothetical protein